MKKLLGIVVLGLFLSGNTFAEKNVKNKIPILMCGGHTIFYPKLPTTYEEFLNDDNLYLKFVFRLMVHDLLISANEKNTNYYIFRFIFK